MIRSLTRSTINSEVWYQSMLVGNAPFIPIAFDLLESTDITSNTLSFSFTGLSSYASTYRHLQLRFIGRTGASGTTTVAQIRFNNSQTGYTRLRISGDGGSFSSNFDGTGQSQAGLGFIGGATVGSLFGVGITDILDAFSTTKNKTFRTLSGVPAATNGAIGIHTGFWSSTAAISSIDLIAPTPGEFLFVPGSRVSLYGIKG